MAVVLLSAADLAVAMPAGALADMAVADSMAVALADTAVDMATDKIETFPTY